MEAIATVQLGERFTDDGIDHEEEFVVGGRGEAAGRDSNGRGGAEEFSDFAISDEGWIEQA